MSVSVGESTLEALQREADILKRKLEEERQKLNDVTLGSVAERLDPIVLTNLKTRRLLKGHQSKVLCTDWSPDKRRLVSSSQDGKVIVWDAFAASRENTLSAGGSWVLACAFGASCVAAGGLDNKLTVFALGEEGEAARRRSVGAHTAYVAACAFPGTDRQLLSASGDATCALWDVESGHLVQNFHAHAADVLSVDAAPAEAGAVFASAGCDRAALVWDMRCARPVHAFDAHPSDVNCVRFHGGGDALATGGDDGVVRVFDLRADREVARLWRSAQLFAAHSVEWSLSGRLLFAGYGDHTAWAWDALRGARAAALPGHDQRVARVQLSPDGTALSTASWDTTIRIWA